MSEQEAPKESGQSQPLPIKEALDKAEQAWSIQDPNYKMKKVAISHDPRAFYTEIGSVRRSAETQRGDNVYSDKDATVISESVHDGWTETEREHADFVHPGETVDVEYRADHVAGTHQSQGRMGSRGGTRGASARTQLRRKHGPVKEFDDHQTIIRRKDTEGNVVYEHMSKDPDFAEKVAKIASKIVMGAAEELETQPKDINEMIEHTNKWLGDTANKVMWHSTAENRQRYEASKNYLYVPMRMNEPSENDHPKNHSEKWHQHGILTHSREFARAMKDAIPGYLEEWGIKDQANKALSERIDNVEKRQLLELASLLHDIGKFTARSPQHDEETNETTFNFDGHADHSGKLIRGGWIASIRDLSAEQREYVAKCAELHFELGEVRKAAKSSGKGYTMKFVDSPDFRAAAQEIIDKHPDYALEIGLLFIADGLSKSEVAARGETDEEIEAERQGLEKQLEEKGLNPKLINQALQMPVNFKIARAYLGQWAHTKTD